MSRFFWVRHGPTHAKAMVGWSDIPADLSDRDHLARLDAFLPKNALLISSDLIRASATADALGDGRERLPNAPGLKEIHFGDWEMQRVDAIPDQTHLRAFWDSPGQIRAPGGESWDELRARVDRAVARLCESHDGRDIVIVAHFGVILTQVQRALGQSAYEAFSHRIDNLSVTELQRNGDLWHAARINHIP